MAAFDKIQSGLAGMDEALDHIRLGDNVVFQVSTLEEFQFFVQPFVRQAIKDGRNLIYIRFAQHPPLLEPQEGLKICRFDPEQGFEAFTVAIHDTITREGRDAFYVFDSLSELQSAWYTDLMMGNFFRVTCPYLFELDTVAYFPLTRGMHSFDAVARIRDTTQLLLDVYSGGGRMYLHPLKVWNRYSAHMFLPHCYDGSTGGFLPLTDGIGMSRYYQLLQERSASAQDQNADSHDRFFAAARMKLANGQFDSQTERLIIESTMTKDPQMHRLIEKYFRPEDYFALRDRMIGSGAIGGKACGMLLARKIVESTLPDYRFHIEPHDSFYIGSDVFYTYIVSNNCWKTRIEQRTEEGYFSAAGRLREALEQGVFPSNIRDQFRNMLEYFGQNPIIVRSSSFLEDGFDNAFAGKYESVFCAGSGDLEERLEAFEQAVRTVYASTMSPSALEYRKIRGLEKRDEQMAVLVQRVSGSYYGQFYMPCAAGVGYSRSAYRWQKDMDPAAGMLRLVMGLGTKAVDRTENDYPRLVNLERPTVTMSKSVAEKHRFSQHKVDVLDLEKNGLTEKPLEELLEDLPLWYKNTVLEHDFEAEETLRQAGRYRPVWFVSCQRLLENRAFPEMMQEILHALEGAYQNPVDIEYTVNCDAGGDFVVNLLQCRPLYVGREQSRVELPQLRQEAVFFELRDASMGQSGVRPVDVVVQVEPKAYYELEYGKKPQAAKAIGRINSHYKGRGKGLLLTAPGRIGTSSPELGVPVSFADISGFCAICEVSDDRAGYMPELSYGSHMFQDLVEAEIFYGAVFGNATTLRYDRDFFRSQEELFLKICPGMEELSGIVRVYETEGMTLWNDSLSNHALCGKKEI